MTVNIGGIIIHRLPHNATSNKISGVSLGVFFSLLSFTVLTR